MFTACNLLRRGMNEVAYEVSVAESSVAAQYAAVVIIDKQMALIYNISIVY